MMKHNVLFKLNEDLSATEAIQVKTDFKIAIEALQDTIDVIKHIEVGFNDNPDENFDIALICEVDSLEDVATYSKHPEHLKAAQILKGKVASRACVDYTI